MEKNMERKVNNWKTLLNQYLTIKPNYRFERKFTVENVEQLALIQNIKRHPTFFQPIFHQRQINNIYLDTSCLAFYHANVKGISVRKKVRIRWYGSTFGKISLPKLEYKLKDNLIGDKWTFELPNFELHKRGVEMRQIQTLLQTAHLPQPIQVDIKNLRPTLLNSYLRSYFLSACKRYRLTFDTQLQYYPIKGNWCSFMNKYEETNRFIIELKYDPKHDAKVSTISSKFPYRLDKSSKYVSGINYGI